MIISDSTTLIILIDLNRFDLLDNLFDNIIIPHTVYDEINFKKEIVLPKSIKVSKVKESQLLHSLKLLLDDGESEAIVLAHEKKLPLIIDEKKGRKIAQNMNLTIIGLLGIVYINIKKEFITHEDAKTFLDNARNNGYRISQKLIDGMFWSLEC
jgi:predicted nucleic acid-binding protein